MLGSGAAFDPEPELVANTERFFSRRCESHSGHRVPVQSVRGTRTTLLRLQSKQVNS